MRSVCAAAVLALLGCAQVGRAPTAVPPLEDEGELLVWLDPFPHESRRLSFEPKALLAVREGGEAVPLRLRLAAVSAAGQVQGQRLLATGRVPPGRYQGFRLEVTAARLAGAEGPSALLVGAEPVAIDAALVVRRGQATVVALALDGERSILDGFAFTPRFVASVPAPTAPGLVGACTSAAGNELVVFDVRTRTVDGVVATGRAPHGLALDPIANRAYLALGGQDQIEIVDLGTGTSTGRLQVRGGDEPRSLLLLPDRRTLLVIAARARAAAFVDSVTGQELARVALGDSPWSVVAQRSGNRAYVPNRRSNTLTAIDLATRQAIATVPTDPEPLFAQVSRDGSRLWLVHAGSLSLVEYALPALSVTRRIRVGLGVSTVKLDARTGLLYVAHGQDGRIEVYDPASALPIDDFDLPAGVSWLAIDDVQGQLYAVMPSRRELAVVDLTSRRVLAVIELPGEPTELRLAAERD